MQKRIRDYGITIGNLKPGPKNKLTDVYGVQVGHCTIDDNEIKTGVTAILPHTGNLFKEKLVAATYIINGFGKSVGLFQIDELGQLETPILLTNTLNVGIVSDCLIEYMLETNDDIGLTTGSVNPVVCECNDSYLNLIRKRSVTKEHVMEAINSAERDFLEGDIGAGKGMVCFGYKGGIGSASRQINFDDKTYTIGVLVLSNFGQKSDLMINHKTKTEKPETEEEKGSIIFIVATDLPLSSRQLKRIIKRVEIGLARVGSFMGNGSGEIVIGFSTHNKINHYEKKGVISMDILNENYISQAFRAVAEASEEAILNSMITAETVIGRDNHTIESLKYYIHQYL